MTLQTHYDSAMLRGPRSVPVIGRLGGGTIATVSDSQPFRVVGTDAVVYQLRQATGKVVALRCWLDEAVPADRMARYRALGSPDTLRHLHRAERSPIIPTLGLHADGVEIETDDLRTIMLPVVVMDWLMGPTLLAAVDRACRSEDASQIAALADAWSHAVLAAADVGFAHGDLTADNAIVRPREGIAFVDYDTAYWPEAPLVPVLAPAVAYRHPRGASTAPERVDDFAALVVYVSLRILAVWPTLRAEHGQPATMRGAGLLFQPRDLAQPDGSPLFGKLRVLNDPQVQGLVGILREACLAEPNGIPPFAEARALAANVANVPGPYPSTAPRGGRVSSILTSAATAARETAGRGTDPLRPSAVAPSIEELWPERQRNWRPERLRALVEAIEQHDLARAELLWDQFRDEPGAGALLPALETLRSEHAPASDAGAPQFRAERSAFRRADVRRRFANALDYDDRAALADLALSGELDDIDDLSEASTRRIVGSLAIGHLQRALESDDDILIMEAYDAAVLGDQGLLTHEQRNRVDLAFDRRAWLEDVRAAMRKQDIAAIDRLYAAMPNGADQRLRERERIRIERMRVQHDALDGLRFAVQQNRDAELVSALTKVEQVGAVMPADIPWTRVSDAIDRESVMRAIHRAAGQHPHDLVRLARLLPQLKELCGGVYPASGDGLDFAQLDGEIRQAVQLSRVREALATNDDRKIVACALPDLYGVLPLLERGEQARIERAVAAASRALRRSGQRGSSSASSSVMVDTI